MTLLEKVAASPLNYRATLIVDPVAAVAFAYYGAVTYSGTVVAAVACVVAGFMAWGFLEYLLHRWVLHGVLRSPRREHAKHHGQPKATISTPVLVIPIGATIIFAALAFVLPTGVAALLTFGIYAGYNYFAIVHHLLHHCPDALARSRYFEAQLRSHEAHHRNPDLHFGISSGLWDRLFGTFLQHEQVVMKQTR